MDLSVVVPTLNGRDALVACLDALGAHVAGELIVVNGPSADGTTGMVRARDDVDLLLELADRNVNVARNAGIEAATGDTIAFVDERTAVVPGWADAVESAVDDGAPAVAGPVHAGGRDADGPERRRIAGRTVTYFDGGNVAFTRDALERIDGFDEYLDIGGSRDAAHRLAAQGLGARWVDGAAARRDPPERRPDGGRRRWGRKYRSLAYRLAKNYGPGPMVWRTLRHAVSDGGAALREVVAGDVAPSRWIGDGRDVAVGGTRGAIDGLVARRRESRGIRNPYGLSSRSGRAVQRYDWR